MKKFFAFVLAVCMILSLVACVKTPENTTPSDSATVPTEDTTAPEQPTEPETPQTFLWDNFDNRDPEVKPDTAPNGANLWWDNWKNLTAENDNGAIKLVYSPKEYDPNDKAGDWMSNWGEAVDMWSLADIAYCKYLTIRVKGEAGGEEAKLLMDWHPIDAKFYAARFSDLVLKDGTHPKITTEWQDLVIDLEASGFPGMTDNMHIRAFASCTIWIDEIYFSEPVAPVDTSSSDAVLAGLTAAETGKPAELPINTYLKELGVLTNNVSGVSSGGTTNSGIPSIPTVSQTFLWDNFNDRDPKVTPSKSPNGATLWWDNWFNLSAANDNGAMKINYTPLAYNPNDKTGEWMGNWGEGIDMWSLSGISNCKYLTIRVKGNAGGEEAKLLLDFRTGEKAYVVRFSDLVLKDGTHPKITTEWQDLVIDLKKSGLPGMTDRMHIRAFASCTIWLDEIIFSEPTQTVWTPVVTGQPGELPIKTYLEELGGTTNPGESTVTTVTYLWDNFDNRDPSVTPATAPSGVTLWWDNWENLTAANENGAIKLSYNPKAYSADDKEGKWMGNWGEGIDMWSLNGLQYCKYLTIRIKGNAGGEEAKLLLDFRAGEKAYVVRFSDLVLKDGTHPKITTQWQDLVIDLQKSGLPGMTDRMHIRAFASCTIWLDEIIFSEPVQTAWTPVETGMPGELPIKTYLEELGGTTNPEQPTDPDQSTNTTVTYLWDNFNDRDPKVTPSKSPNGATLWWDNWYNLNAANDNGAVKINYTPLAYNPNDKTGEWMGNWGEGIDMLSLSGISNCKYLTIRIKGNVGGEEAKLLLHFRDASNKEDVKDYVVRFSDLVLKDGTHPKITTEWQDLVIDLEKSGFPGMTDTMFIRAFAACTIWLDEIYFSEPAPAAWVPVATGQPGELPIKDYLDALAGGTTNPDQSGGDTDQSGGDTDQSGGNTDQSGGNTDQSGGDSDQSGGDSDQSGGDSDQSTDTTKTYLWDNFDDRIPGVKPDTAPNGATIWWENDNDYNNVNATYESGIIKLAYSPKEYDANDTASTWMGDWGQAVDMWSLADIAYCKYLTIRIKGNAGGEEAKLLMDWHPNDAKFYAARFSDLVLKDGTHPEITTEWQDLVIDLEASGFPGMTNTMHIRAFAACTISIDEIYFSEPIASVDTSSSDAVLAGLTATETGKPADLPIQTYLAWLAAGNKFEWDNFSLDERTNDGTFDHAPNGATIWWEKADNLTKTNESGIIKLDYNPSTFVDNDTAGTWMGDWGQAVNMWALENIAYCRYLTIRVKGDVGGEEAKLLLNWHPNDTKYYSARFSDLVLKDGGHPEITTEWQDLVIDLEASGFPGMTNAMHIYAIKSCSISIDEIYFSNPVTLVDTSSSDAILAGITAPETGKPVDLPIQEYLAEL